MMKGLQNRKSENQLCRYHGSYKEDKRNGRGVFEYADGGRYIGDYKDDKKHGVGTYMFPDGAACLFENVSLNQDFCLPNLACKKI